MCAKLLTEQRYSYIDFDPSTLQVFAALTTPPSSALAIFSWLHDGTEEGAPLGVAVVAAVVGFAVGTPVGKGVGEVVGEVVTPVGKGVGEVVEEVVGGRVSATTLSKPSNLATSSVRSGASTPAGRVKVMSLPGRGAGVIIPI